jgi:hypothetical protein
MKSQAVLTVSVAAVSAPKVNASSLVMLCDSQQRPYKTPAPANEANNVPRKARDMIVQKFRKKALQSIE